MSGPRARGGPARAFWLETASFAACEIGALAGYDLVVLDMEHGVIAPDAADVLIAHAGRLGLRVYSRVAAPERVPIQHALDSGADGVILPQIRDAGHAREAAAFAKYPPVGSRGIGFSRTKDYGQVGAGFTDEENARTRCYAMIETPQALEDCAEIAALAALDGLFVGPGDLSLTRGRGLYQGTEADFEDARRVARAALGAGKTWGMPAGTERELRLARDAGAEFVTVADDLSALRAGLEDALRLGEE